MMIFLLLTNTLLFCARGEKIVGGGVSSTYSDEDWNALFDACFYHKEKLERAMFFVNGYDEQFGRDVSLAFIIISTGNFCHLEWDRPHTPGSHTVIINRSTNDKVMRPQNVQKATQIGFEFASDRRVEHYWRLNHLFPNGYVSGSFLRSVLVKGMAKYSSKYFNEIPIPMKLLDKSNIMIEYWLEKGTGQTYYESFWNLKYDCLVHRLGDSNYGRVREIFSHAVENLVFEGEKSYESEWKILFTPLLDEWKATKSQDELSAMKIRDFLKEFMPFWKTKVLDDHDREVIAAEIVRFCFVDDPNYDIIEYQLLKSQCRDMTGYPVDPSNREIGYEFREKYLPPVPEFEWTGRMDALHLQDLQVQAHAKSVECFDSIVWCILFCILFAFTSYVRTLIQTSEMQSECSSYHEI